METLSDLIRGFDIGEVLGFDLYLGVAGGIGAGWFAYHHPAEFGLLGTMTLAGLGALLSAIVAAVALITAFLSPEFLRTLDHLDEKPLQFIAPFLFTAVLAIVAIPPLAVAVAANSLLHPWLLALLGGFGLGTGLWGLLSLLRDFNTLVEFVQIQTLSARGNAPPSPELH